MYRIISTVVVALGYFSIANAFGFGPGLPSCRGVSSITQTFSRRMGHRSFTPPSMSTPGAARSASDVLAELDELDSVLGVESQDQEDLKPKQAYLNKLAVQAAQSRWREVEGDSGSPRIQVAILTEKIVYLTRHMQRHPQDFHSRRGLIAMVNRRRKQLNYYFRQEPSKCLEMCQALGIRFRPRTKVRSREQRYAAFRNTKSKIGEARRTELINKEREKLKQSVPDSRKVSRAARGYT